MKLPAARGDLSAALIGTLERDPDPSPGAVDLPSGTGGADPFGDDVQLALFLAYELHYRGFDGVDDGWEWHPEVLRLRGALERAFLAALRTEVPVHPDVESALDGLLVEPVEAGGITGFLREEGELRHLREYAALRSLYHLKEGDPHAYAIPHLLGRAKAGFVAVEYDEYGSGRADRMHQRLFADLMADLGLDPAYGRYLEEGTPEMLATVNLMSLFGLHRALRGAMVGHYASVEITSSPASRRMTQAMERLGAGPAAIHFYAEHVEADAVHEQVMRREVVGGLLADEPELAGDVVFGIDATEWLEDRLARSMITPWREGRSALRAP
ncbi:iron-containing redox enzyme family protein [Streptomyces sp. RFCAC02]|uniref:iron-containing redox enzyme family protein n=1 Tax=Streptomyces sp. RFCAC02 TaxID=2499143 RepID=UPI00102201F0|nr:iron-containing redox enzyme family protein [Streptomyces sp. RFCAC02]